MSNSSTNLTHRPSGPRFAHRGHSNFDIVVVLFCAVLVISNIAAVKLINVGPITLGQTELGPLIVDGGVFLFPLAYVLGDVISEVYGFRAARRAIALGFGISILASLTFWIVGISPAADDWGNQEAWDAVLGFVPRIVLASILGYAVGQLLNAWVLVRIKARTNESKLWVRLLGSTAVGEFFDTIIFCTIAFYGVVTGGEFLNYVITGYIYKCLIEVLLLPITYRVIAVVKKHEPSYASTPVAT